MMDPKHQRRSLVAFFLGARAAVLDKNDADIVRHTGRRAYRDLSRTLHGIGTHPQAQSLREETYESLKDFVADLDQVQTAEEFDEHHHAWCMTTTDRFSESRHPQRDFAFHYGQAQKWLNMTLKYLAVLDHGPVAHVYGFMHVPIDQIIYTQARRIGVELPGRTKWSRLNSDQYQHYQKQLKERIAVTRGEDYVPLDWEAQVWIEREINLEED